MHEIQGDNFVINPIPPNQRIFDDEDLGVPRDATQVTHQMLNALQEEISNVIRAEGITLNSSSESIESMVQLNQAINAKIATQSASQNIVDTAQDVIIQTNSNHRTGNGSDHSNVTLNDNHRNGNGSDHGNVALNDNHRTGNGADHSNVVLNNNHRNGNGSDHTNVTLNDNHRNGNGSDHSDVSANTAALAGLPTFIHIAQETGASWLSLISPENSGLSDGITMVGAKVGDAVLVTLDNRTTVSDLEIVVFEGIVSAPDTVKIWAINPSSTISVSSGSLNAGIYNITVTSF